MKVQISYQEVDNYGMKLAELFAARYICHGMSEDEKVVRFHMEEHGEYFISEIPLIDVYHNKPIF